MGAPGLPGPPAAGFAPAARGTSPNPAQGSTHGGTPHCGGHAAERAPAGRCRSLLPPGGRVCAGLSARPFFSARHEVMLQLMRLAMHCRDSWVRCLRTPAHMRPPLGDRFPMDYFPRPLEPPPPPLVAQIKVNMFNIWPKINTLISSFNFFRGG